MPESFSPQPSDKAMDIESINDAKRRLLELEPVNKEIAALEGKAEAEAKFTNRLSIFLIVGETIIVLMSVAEIYYYLTRQEPFTAYDLSSVLLSVLIAGSLIRRLDGWRQAKLNERHLHDLRRKTERERAIAESIIDRQNYG